MGTFSWYSVKKAFAKSTEKPHDPNLILAMGIASRRVEYDIRCFLPVDSAEPCIAVPQITVNGSWSDAHAVVEMVVSEQAWHNMVYCLLN